MPRKDGTVLISDERERQRSTEGFTYAHDQQHAGGELIWAASGYLYAARIALQHGLADPLPVPETWPFEERWWKPSDDPIRNLEKAGALIAAEIDRIQRKTKEKE